MVDAVRAGKLVNLEGKTGGILLRLQIPYLQQRETLILMSQHPAKPLKQPLIPRILSIISIVSSLVAFLLLSGVIEVADPGFVQVIAFLSFILPFDAILLAALAMYFLVKEQRKLKAADVRGMQGELLNRAKRLARLALVFAIGALATLLHAVLYKGMLDLFM